MILGHCHIAPAGYFRLMEPGMREETGTIAELEPYRKELGCERSVVFAPFNGRTWRSLRGGDANEWLLGAVADDPSLIPWMVLDERGPEAAELLKRCADRGARGVKFHPPIVRIAIDDPALEEFYALAERMRFPILYHTGPHGWDLESYRPLRVDRIAQRHPQLPLIIEHLGGGAFVRETRAVMQNNPNVYGGLASCLPEDASWNVPEEEFRRLLKDFGPGRFIFGSDYPWNDTATNRRALKVLAEAGIGPADAGRIVSGNLEELDKLVRPG